MILLIYTESPQTLKIYRFPRLPLADTMALQACHHKYGNVVGGLTDNQCDWLTKFLEDHESACMYDNATEAASMKSIRGDYQIIVTGFVFD